MKYKKYWFLLSILSLVGCKSEKKEAPVWRTKINAEKNAIHNTLLDIEREQGWQLLFDGKTLDGWHLFNNTNTTSVWKVEDGMLYCAAQEKGLPQGDLVTDREYENYELKLEWRISGRGNSGIFINVQETPKYSAAWQTGPEYQILDPEHMDYDDPLKKTGCLYGFLPQLNNANTRPKGQWNETRIIQQDGKITFYLNGRKTATADFKDSKWKKMIENSGFKDRAGFGLYTKGKIALQDWYFEVWFRNIKIKPLEVNKMDSQNSI